MPRVEAVLDGEAISTSVEGADGVTAVALISALVMSVSAHLGLAAKEVLSIIDEGLESNSVVQKEEEENGQKYA